MKAELVDAVLDSYEEERIGCANATRDLSMANYQTVIEISAALGADPQ
jgi:hypothetical protein